ncbi:MAG: hypothetical protein ACI9PP_000051 [Halobacteriales archaeon]
MILVVTYSKAARGSLRNVCRIHETPIVRRFGRAVLLEETEFGAFLALRLREKHPGEVSIERTGPLDPTAVPHSTCQAARAFETRSNPSTSYSAFATWTDYPSIESMRDRRL